MLQVAPTHWYSDDFTVHHASQQVADVDMSFWRAEGLLTAEGVRYRVCRESWMSGSAFFRTYLVHYGDRQYTLRARSAFRRAFVLFDGSRQIGSIEPVNAFTNKATAGLPDGWLLPVRAFVIWLTIIQWRREKNR